MSAGFQCKKFYVAHDQCAMKVGTDGLLLGAWAPLPDTGTAILDIGAGSGLISLMLAQRTAGASPIDAIELDPAACTQATTNVANSPWPHAVTLIKGDILTYHSAKRYSLIVSNPPFFQQSLASVNPQRQQARHTDSLPFAALAEKAASLLKPDGTLALVLPSLAAEQFITLAAQYGLYLARRCDVKTSVKKAPLRALLAFSAVNGLAEHSELVIHATEPGYSRQYRQLLQAFYLKF